VDIFFEPLALPDGRVLPLRAPVARLEPRDSAGHESTVEAEDTVGDIFVPVLHPMADLPSRVRISC